VRDDRGLQAGHEERLVEQEEVDQRGEAQLARLEDQVPVAHVRQQVELLGLGLEEDALALLVLM
jgi:hypothetical protein